MKKLKKLIKYLIIVVAITGLVGCSSNSGGSESTSGKSGYEIYEQAAEKASEEESIEANIKMNMEMSYADQTMNMKMIGPMKVKMNSQTDIELYMDMTTTVEMMGETSSYEVKGYYKDGYNYIEIMDYKMKAEMPVETAKEQINIEVTTFGEEAVKEEKVTETSEGYQIELTLEASAVESILSGQLGSMEEYLATGEYSYSDIRLEALVDKEGELKTTKLEFSLEMGEESLANIVMDIEYIAFGSDVEIQAPADLDDYMEVDASMMGY